MILTDDLELGANRKVLSQGILIGNIKALTLTSQKIWSMLKVFVDKQTDKRTSQKPNATDLLMRGIEKMKMSKSFGRMVL